MDYFQQIRPPRDLRTANRLQQLQEVANLLRIFAKGGAVGKHPADLRLATALLVGAQVNRETVGGGSAKPSQPELHHLREGDDLPNAMAGCLSIHRPVGEDGSDNAMTVKIVKNRDGRRDRKLEWTFHGASRWITEDATVRPIASRYGVGQGSV